MLAAGWATTYEQAGAEYGRWGKDAFLRAESIAKWVFTISCNHLAAACLILFLPRMSALQSRSMWHMGKGR